MTSERAARWATLVRWAAAAVFVVFGAGKFVDHASELASFRAYGLPAPGVAVIVVGVLELAGGLLLASGRLLTVTALALAADMVGAIVVAGLGEGELLSLTLAPLMLAAMIVLLIRASARPSGRALRADPSSAERSTRA